MSASNPNVRRWIVRYWGGDGGREVLRSAIVWAPNRMFARWNARDVIGHHSGRSTASIYRGDQ